MGRPLPGPSGQAGSNANSFAACLRGRGAAFSRRQGGGLRVLPRHWCCAWDMAAEGAPTTGGAKRPRDARRGPLSSKKQRKEPHVEGRWPVLVHIPLPSASVAEIDAATEPLLPCLSSEHTHTWHSTWGEFSSASMHVSLSRVLYVWEAALPDFTQRVAAALGEPGGQRQFTAALQGGRILPGEGGASSFLAATFTPHAAACVRKLIAAVDEVCRACGQPSYHTVRQAGPCCPQHHCAVPAPHPPHETTSTGPPAPCFCRLGSGRRVRTVAGPWQQRDCACRARTVPGLGHLQQQQQQ